MNKPHKAPCCNCENRKLKCHSNCKKYQEWKEMLNDYNKWRRRERDKEYMLNNKNIRRVVGEW